MRSLAKLLHKISHGTWVDVTTTATHHESGKRSESHGSVDNLAVLHGSY